MGAEAVARSLEAHLHSVELYNIQAARAAAVQAPNILRRNLSYVDASSRRAVRQQGSGVVLTLQVDAEESRQQGSTGAAVAGSGRVHAADSSGAAAWGTGSSSRADNAARDVIVAALCVRVQQEDEEAFVPISARAIVLSPQALQAPLCLQLPLGGSRPVLAGLAVILLHQSNPHLASLLTLVTSGRPGGRSRQHSAGANGSSAGANGSSAGANGSSAGANGSSAGANGSSSSSSGGGCSKAVSASVTKASAFRLLPSGSRVGYTVIPLDDPAQLAPGASAGAPSNGKRQQQWRQQGKLSRVEGSLTTHAPLPSSNGSNNSALHFPWIQLRPCKATQQQQQQQQGETAATAGDAAGLSGSLEPQFSYRLSLSGSSGGSGGAEERGQGGNGSMPLAGIKRKASEALGEGNGGHGEQQQQLEEKPDQQALVAAANGHHAASEAPGDGSAAAAAAGVPGSAGASQQQAVQPPPRSQQHAAGPNAQPQPQPLLTFYFSSFDGSKYEQATRRGFCCPLACCRGLRCHSYAGLQQHMQASHSYHSCYFSDVMPGGELEVYLRCKPAWCDARGGFLPRQLAMTSLDAHPLNTLLARSHILRPFLYHCSRRQRVLRLSPRGRYPVDEEEAQLEREAEEQVAASLAEEEAAALLEGTEAAPSSSGPLTSSLLVPATTSASAGSGSRAAGAEAGAAAPSGSRGTATAASGGAGAAQVQAGKAADGAGGRRGRGGIPAGLRGMAAVRARGGRKAAVPVRRSSKGLEPLTAEGKPKFYHSRTCVAMTRAELLSPTAIDSDSDGDLAEWQRDCQERLQEKAELCAEQRAFMFEWNLFAHHNPVHADADLPAAVERFAKQHEERLGQDGAFRRCLLAYLLNLWRFRLLTPQQLHTLTSSLPRLAA